MNIRALLLSLFLTVLAAPSALPQGKPSLLWMRSGVRNYVHDVAANPEGTLVAIADTARAHICRISDGQLIKTLPWTVSRAVAFGNTHFGPVLALKLDSQVILLRTTNWETLWVFANPTLVADSFLEFSADGRYLLTESRVFDVPALQEKTFTPALTHVMGYSGDRLGGPGLFLARDTTGSYEVHHLDGSPSYTFNPIELREVGIGVIETFEARFVTPNGNRFYVQSANSGVLHTHTSPNPLYLAEWAPDFGGFLVTDDAGGHVQTFRASDYSLDVDYAGHVPSTRPTIAKYAPSTNLIVSGSQDVHLWRTDGQVATNITAHNMQGGGLGAIAYSPDGRLVATSTFHTASQWDLGIKIWNAQTGEWITTIDAGREVAALAFAPDGQSVFVGRGSTNQVGRFRISDGTCVQKLPANGGVFQLAISRDGVLAAGYWGSGVTLFDIATGQPLMSSSLLEGALAFSRDGRHLVAASSTAGGAVVASVPDLTPLLWFVGHTGGRDVAWQGSTITLSERRPDGEAVTFWEPWTGQFRTVLVDGAVTTVAMSPDGRYALTGGFDNQLRIFSVASGQRLRYYDQEIEGGAGSGQPYLEMIAFAPRRTEFSYLRSDGSVVAAKFPFRVTFVGQPPADLSR